MSAQLIATGRHRGGHRCYVRVASGYRRCSMPLGPTVIAGVGAVEPLVLPSASRPVGVATGSGRQYGAARPRPTPGCDAGSISLHPAIDNTATSQSRIEE